MNKVAFFTTIFPMKEEYILKFLSSIDNQLYKEFDLIIVNDGFTNLTNLLNKFNNINVTVISGCNNIAKNREVGINYCIDNGYEKLIFGDSDDYFSDNRVKSVVHLLNDYDIVVNDLSLFSSKGLLEDKYLSKRISNEEVIEYNFVKNKNVFGLSNTGISLMNIKKMSFPSDIEVLDWYMFSILLLENKKAIFTNEAVTYYRQHSDNIIGLKSPSIESYKKGIRVKLIHYKKLLKLYNKDFFINEISRLNKINTNSIKMKNSEKNPLWWELI